MNKKVLVYVGTYTCPIKFGTGQILEGKGEGIYLFELDLHSGELKAVQTFTGVVNPSYLVLNQKKGYLYAVNELKEYEGKASGSVSSFSVSKDGKLSFINKQPTGGTDPCHVEVNLKGTHIYVSNFMSGSVSVYPLNSDGSIEPASQFIQHEGSSINSNRQSGPHTHSLTFPLDGKFAFVPDLGIDKLMAYTVDSDTQTLKGAPVPYFSSKPGAGPRYCAFHPNKDFCYLINELDCTILVLKYNNDNGSFTKLQSVSSLPDGLTAAGNSCADVHITPDGRYLYGSNRGHNSLIIYSVADSGLLRYAGCQSSGGKIPRNFTIDPTGRYLLCANQDSDNIVVFEIDHATGELSKKAETAVPTPVCVRSYIFN